MRNWLVMALIGMLFGMGIGSHAAWAQDETPAPAPTSAAAEATTPPPSIQELASGLKAAQASAASLKIGIDTVWVMVAAMLVFFMNLGFACVESGMCRAKNCVNILSKNFVVFAAASIAFWVFGWGIMFGNGSPYCGSSGLLMVSGKDTSPALTFGNVIKADINATFGVDLYNNVTCNDPAFADLQTKIADIDSANLALADDKTVAVKLDVPGKGTFEKTYAAGDFYRGDYYGLSWPGVPLWAKFFFQLVFTGTCATIVSGAVAERIKYHSFIIFSFLISIFIYPVVGHWIWGGGWLQAGGFIDFAGSTQVHSIGGWAALVGILVLGPRIGKFAPDGRPQAIPGHSMMAATIGCFVLWFGWFGFNPGSTMGVDAAAIADIAVTTNMAAAAATLTATITAWLLLGKPDLGMTLNGCLAGLVAITAPCAFVSVGSAAIIGACAGVLVVLAVGMFDKLGIDDPVGATSVHLVNGVFGTLCVGLFSKPDLIVSRTFNAAAKGGLFVTGDPAQLIMQLKGVVATALYVLPVALVCWLVLKYTIGIRVSREEEQQGLDHGEHGNEAYHGFAMTGSH